MGPLRLAKGNVDQLIQEVRKHRCLYDKTLEIYKDPNAKEKAWTAVSEALQQDTRILKAEWKKLRDCFREALKREKRFQIDPSGNKPFVQWKYRAEMDFILPFMSSRESFACFPDTSAELDSPSSKLEVEETPVEEYHLPEVTSEESQSQTVVQYLTTVEDKKGMDPLDMFFASMCESTKRLPAPYQNTIKRELFQAVMQAEEQYQLEQASPLQFHSRSVLPCSTSQDDSSHAFTDGSVHMLKVVNVVPHPRQT